MRFFCRKTFTFIEVVRQKGADWVDYKTLNASVIVKENFSQHLLKHKIEENLQSMNCKLRDFSMSDIGESRRKLGKSSYLLSYSIEGNSINFKQVIGGLQGIKLELNNFTIESMNQHLKC